MFVNVILILKFLFLLIYYLEVTYVCIFVQDVTIFLIEYKTKSEQ